MAHGSSRNTDPDTSHAAAQSVNATKLEKIVVKTMTKAKTGLTSYEVAEITGISIISISPRFAPLREKGIVYDTGERRKREGSSRSRIVWQLCSLRPKAKGEKA